MTHFRLVVNRFFSISKIVAPYFSCEYIFSNCLFLGVYVSYGRYIEGTGSMLKVQDTAMPLTPSDSTSSVRVYQNMVRFLSPREIANLHCFPSTFGKTFFCYFFLTILFSVNQKLSFI